MLKAIVEATGVDYGDTLDVVVERDTQERTIDPPPEMKEALATNKPAAAAWDELSFTRKRELARGFEEAKKPETKARRLAAAIAELTTRSSRP